MNNDLGLYSISSSYFIHFATLMQSILLHMPFSFDKFIVEEFFIDL